MGIKGFHQDTKHFIRKTHVSKYRGQRVGCDASAWLHRGAVLHAWYIVGPGKDDQPWAQNGADPPWVDFSMKMIAMLKENGVEPVIVFDGRRAPAKAGTNGERQRRKERARAEAKAHIDEGRQEAASRALTQAVDITPDMAYDLILRLQAYGIAYIVAPYEADAQLAHLAALPYDDGGVAAVITEDSDLVAYGCPVVLFKCTTDGDVEELSAEVMFADIAHPQTLDPNHPNSTFVAHGTQHSDSHASHVSGDGDTITGDVISNGIIPVVRQKGPRLIDFKGWNREMVRIACVLAGCDFLKSIPGVGFKTAHGYVSRGRSLQCTLRIMREKKSLKSGIPDGYMSSAELAVSCFAHALIYDIRTKRCSRLTPLPSALESSLPEEKLAHLGLYIDDDEAHKQACGWLHPHSFVPFDDGRALVSPSWIPRPIHSSSNLPPLQTYYYSRHHHPQQRYLDSGPLEQQQYAKGAGRSSSVRVTGAEGAVAPIIFGAATPVPVPAAEARRHLFGMTSSSDHQQHHHQSGAAMTPSAPHEAPRGHMNDLAAMYLAPPAAIAHTRREAAACVQKSSVFQNQMLPGHVPLSSNPFRRPAACAAAATAPFPSSSAPGSNGTAYPPPMSSIDIREVDRRAGDYPRSNRATMPTPEICNTSRQGASHHNNGSWVPETQHSIDIEIIAPSDEELEQQEVTSPLRPARNPDAHNATLRTQAQSLSAGEPGGPSGDSRVLSSIEGQDSALEVEWNVKRPEMHRQASRFSRGGGGSFVTGGSSRDGFAQSGKLRNDTEGRKGANKKRKAAMEAAASHCMRISSYFGRRG